MSSEVEYKFYYFNAKVLGEPIRMIFKIAGVPFEDNRIEFSEWPELKPKLGWQKMPVLKFGDTEICQSTAIATYLGKKYNMVGKDDFEFAKVQEYIGVANDCRQGWRNWFWEKEKNKKAELRKIVEETDFPNYLSKFSKLIEANGGKWLVGTSLTIADLFLVVFVELFEETFEEKLLDKYPVLKSYKENIYAIPQIKEWIETRPKAMW